jgi:hypothetical protein
MKLLGYESRTLENSRGAHNILHNIHAKLVGWTICWKQGIEKMLEVASKYKTNADELALTEHVRTNDTCGKLFAVVGHRARGENAEATCLVSRESRDYLLYETPPAMNVYERTSMMLVKSKGRLPRGGCNARHLHTCLDARTSLKVPDLQFVRASYVDNEWHTSLQHTIQLYQAIIG